MTARPTLVVLGLADWGRWTSASTLRRHRRRATPDRAPWQRRVLHGDDGGLAQMLEIMKNLGGSTVACDLSDKVPNHARVVQHHEDAGQAPLDVVTGPTHGVLRPLS